MIVFANSAACSAAVARNREPILAVLKRVLPARGVVLEIASGTGEHAVHFAAGLPHLTWQPTDRDPGARQSIAEYRAAARLPNLLAALELDASASSWPVARADAVVAINMIHIAPWTAAEGLMAGAGRTLPSGGVLYLYGPFKQDGRHIAPSNADFDAEPHGARSGVGGARSRRRFQSRPRAWTGSRGAHLHARQQPKPGLSIPNKLRAATPERAHHGQDDAHCLFSRGLEPKRPRL